MGSDVKRLLLYGYLSKFDVELFGAQDSIPVRFFVATPDLPFHGEAQKVFIVKRGREGFAFQRADNGVWLSLAAIPTEVCYADLPAVRCGC